MTRLRLSAWTTLAIVALPAVTGCFGRGEKIKIARDGSATVSINYEGSVEDFQTADALPSHASGWDVSVTVKQDGDEQKQEMVAERVFAPGDDLPSSYAGADDPDADLYLSFPTDVRIEERSDGTYYYFTRTYQPRRWAYVHHWHEMFFDDSVKKLGEKSKEELTQEDLVSIVQAFAGVEAFKQMEFAKTALAECEPSHGPEVWLFARRALLDVYEKEADFFAAIIQRCEQPGEEEQQSCFDEEAQRFLDTGYAALVGSLSEQSGFTAARLAAFDAAFDRALLDYSITDELGGHYFEIEVEMPGTVIAHNADKADTDADENVTTVQWQFEGNAFRDRPQELIVVSRVDHDSEVTPRSAIDGIGQ